MSEFINSKPKRNDNIIEKHGNATWEMDRFMDEVETAINGYVQLANYTTTVAPGVTNDASEGYSVGSEWLDTTGPTFYKCTDATIGAAVWIAI